MTDKQEPSSALEIKVRRTRRDNRSIGVKKQNGTKLADVMAPFDPRYQGLQMPEGLQGWVSHPDNPWDHGGGYLLSFCAEVCCVRWLENPVV